MALAGCLCIAAAIPAVAGTFTVFGPETYRRASGPPGTVVRNFSVLDPTTTYVLRVHNGGVHGEFPRALSATISLNGVQVLVPTELGPDVPLVEKPVTLQASNKLAVQVRGRPGSGLAVEVIGTDNTPPTISAHADPAANSNGWNNTNVTVTFTCADATSGIASCTAPVTVAAEGAGQVVTGTAVDKAGNTASASVTLNIDKTAPVITAAPSPPANGNGWNNTDVIVSFNCSDSGSPVVSCPGPVAVTAEGAGQVVSGTATDQAGNSSSTSITLNIDKTPPVISGQTSPSPNGNGWNNTEVMVSFTCTDGLSQIDACPGPITVGDEGERTVPGTATDRAGNQASTSVSFRIDRTPPTITATQSPAANANGWNNTDVTVSFNCSDARSQVESCPSRVTISSEGEGQAVSGTATDRAGNSASASASVSLDKTPPSLTITSPADGAAVSESPIVVGGSSDDGLSGLDHVSCNGAPALVSGLSFSCPVALNQGANPIAVESADRAGNAATRSITVNLLQRLLVTITSPASLALFRSGPVTVTGTVDRPVVSVSVNGVAAVVSGQSFTAEGVPLREGHNLLTATATDAGGAVGSGSVTVTLDTTPPTIHIDAPTEGAILTTAQVTVTGMINDIVTGTVNAEQATVTVNGVPATVSNRSFVVGDLLLARGVNTITAVARDRAGNESQTSIHVTFQDVAGQQRIVMLSGNNQSGMIGTTLPEPLVVSIQDAFGRPLPGRPVTFTVARTDGVVKAFPDEGRAVTVVSDDRGQASALFQLGTRTGAGNNQVAVTSPGFVGELMFCASATVGPPTRINPDAVMGESFVGIVGARLSTPLVVIVLDAGGNPVSGVPVTFAAQGGGHLGEGRTMVTTATDSDGKAAVTLTLSDQPGISNNIVAAAFENMDGGPVVYKATGVAPGPAAQTRVSGVVLDNTDHPVPNATAKIVGTPLQVMTNEHGQFSIAGAPVGTITLIVDGRTSTRPEAFPFLAFQMMTIAGQDNTIGMPIYLPPLNTEGSQVVGGDQEVTLTMPGVPGLAFTVFPHSTTFPDGSRTGRLTVSQVHADRVPMPPPHGSAPRIVWTLQPAGVHFDPPIRVQIPNTDALPPGQVIEVFQFDHDIEQFVSTGPARVSEDGSVIVSDPGFGITKSGWGGAPPPPPPPKKQCVGGCDDKNACTTDSCVDGSCQHANVPDGSGCDDQNKCTINDACKGGTCKGDPVQVNSITGACVAGTGRAVTYTAASNAPDRLEWTAATGNPATGSGGSFTTTFATTGSKTVTASCGPNSKSKTTNVVTPCPPNTAVVPTFPSHINQGHLANPQIAVTNYHGGIMITVNDNVCLDAAANNWVLRVQSATKPIDSERRLPPGSTQIVVGGNTTAANYCQQVRDVISCSVNRLCGVTWFDIGIINVHENFHITAISGLWANEWPTLETNLENLSVSAAAVCDAGTAQTQLTAGRTNAINQSTTRVTNAYNNTGAAEEAAAQASEAPTRNALIQQICAFGKAQGFPACAVCPP